MTSPENPFVALSVERLLSTLRARDLLQELQRSLGSGTGTASARVLPPYDAAGVGQAASDIHALHAALVETAASAASSASASATPHDSNNDSDDSEGEGEGALPAAVRLAAVVQRAAIEHERACVLAYLRTRLAEVERLRWELSSATLPAAVAAGTTSTSSTGGSDTAPPRLSELERSYYTAYSRLLSRFMARIAEGGAGGNKEKEKDGEEGGDEGEEEDDEEEEEEDEGALEDALLDINGDLLGFPPRPVQTGGATGGLGGAGAGLADGLFVQVRGTGDPAAREEVLTRDGPISLARDAVQWVRLDSTVHALLKQGRLVHFQ